MSSGCKRTHKNNRQSASLPLSQTVGQPVCQSGGWISGEMGMKMGGFKGWPCISTWAKAGKNEPHGAVIILWGCVMYYTGI